MRICYLSHDINPETGCGKVTGKLVETVKKTHPEWEIIVLTTQATDFPEEKPWLAGKYKLLINFFKIRSLIKKCDLIHALDGFPYGVVAALATLGLKKKLIITGIGTGAISAFYHPIYAKFLRFAYQRADKVFAISHYTAREINKMMPQLRVEIIPLGVDFADFCQKDSATLPQQISDKKPYLLTVGMIKERKGYHISLPAFAEVAKRVPDLNYIIVGDPASNPAYFSQLQETIKKLNIEKRVFFYSKVSREFLRQLYNQAELFFLISQDIKKDVEGFGLVFLEAAASGLPVIGSKNCGAEDAILDKQNGFLVKPNDIREISQAIIKILNDKNLKNRFSKKSIAFAKSMDWYSQMSNYLRVYETL